MSFNQTIINTSDIINSADTENAIRTENQMRKKFKVRNELRIPNDTNEIFLEEELPRIRRSRIFKVCQEPGKRHPVKSCFHISVRAPNGEAKEEAVKDKY